MRVTGVQLEFRHPTYGASGEGFAIMMSGNELPDIIIDFGAYYNGGVETAFEDGVIHDLTNDFFYENGEVTHYVRSERYKEWLKLYKDWYDKGYIGIDFATTKAANARKLCGLHHHGDRQRLCGRRRDGY